MVKTGIQCTYSRKETVKCFANRSFVFTQYKINNFIQFERIPESSFNELLSTFFPLYSGFSPE